MKSEMSRKSDMFHPYTLVIHPDFKELGDFILSLPERFEKNEGIVIHKGRNELRKMEYGGREYVVKSFHRPNIINRFVYGIFRPSKAKRSYDHAELYLRLRQKPVRRICYHHRKTSHSPTDLIGAEYLLS